MKHPSRVPKAKPPPMEVDFYKLSDKRAEKMMAEAKISDKLESSSCRSSIFLDAINGFGQILSD